MTRRRPNGKWDRTAPFDLKGNLLHYPKDWNALRGDEAEWRPVEEFEATLRYGSFTRGRSAAYLLFYDSEGHQFPMFLAELDAALPYFRDGSVTGTWTITKRGENFGVKLVKAVPNRRDAALHDLLQAARAECAQFKFPDEDRPRLWEAVEVINEIDSK